MPIMDEDEFRVRYYALQGALQVAGNLNLHSVGAQAYAGQPPGRCRHYRTGEECDCPPATEEQTLAYSAAVEAAEVDRVLRVAGVFAAWLSGEARADDADAALREWHP